MTDLTEQWKKGELPDGYYYCKTGNGVEILRTWGDKYNKLLNNLDEVFIKEMSDCEIISEVPSYDEWQRILHYAGKYEFEYTSCAMDYENLKEENQQLKKWCEEFNALEVAKENTKLKELLKECGHLMQIEKDFASCHFEKDKLTELLNKIDEVIK